MPMMAPPAPSPNFPTETSKPKRGSRQRPSGPPAIPCARAGTDMSSTGCLFFFLRESTGGVPMCINARGQKLQHHHYSLTAATVPDSLDSRKHRRSHVHAPLRDQRRHFAQVLRAVEGIARRHKTPLKQPSRFALRRVNLLSSGVLQPPKLRSEGRVDVGAAAADAITAFRECGHIGVRE